MADFILLKPLIFLHLVFWLVSMYVPLWHIHVKKRHTVRGIWLMFVALYVKVNISK